MTSALPRLAAWLSLLGLARQTGAITVEVFETLSLQDAYAYGEYLYTGNQGQRLPDRSVEPIDNDCYVGKCVGLLTRDRSLELDSRYGCTQPTDLLIQINQIVSCGVEYALSDHYLTEVEIASVKIALHPDSGSKILVYVDNTLIVDGWEATPGSGEMEEIPGLKGLTGSKLSIQGVLEKGDYFAILETEIYVAVDEIETLGVSASTRATISATATTDTISAMKTVDEDVSNYSSWTCSSGETCEITYDLEAVESLEQLRIAFADATDDGGEFNVMAAAEDGIFFSVRTGIEAGGRPTGSDGLQTFGAVRALARYVKLEAVPGSGGGITINEIEFRVGKDAPTRPVTEKVWLKNTGMLPLGGGASSFGPTYDVRAPSIGGCDSPAHFEGCHVYYVKDGDMDSRWSCGPLAAGSISFAKENCELYFSLNYFRYIRQIQIAFHEGDEKHNEFSIEARTAKEGWVVVVPSAVNLGDTTDYQTFDLRVHADQIKLVPKFHSILDWVGIKEIAILERQKKAFVAGTVPVLQTLSYFENDDDDAEGSNVQIPTQFKFDIPEVNDRVILVLPESSVTALRMRFPAGREFTFKVTYRASGGDNEKIEESFTTAGGQKDWEIFTLTEAASGYYDFTLEPVSGPSFASKPDYPTLRVLDFQVVGELTKPAGYFDMVTTTMTEWNLIPDIIGDGISEQLKIMTAICETKGAPFDGTDCVGDLNDSTVYINVDRGDLYLDGPVFIKSGVTLSGGLSDEFPGESSFILYEGPNNANAAEDALIVIDGVTDADVENIKIKQKSNPTGDIVPGTLGNICMDVRDSQDIRFSDMYFREARTGAARFVNSTDISLTIFWGGDFETGNFMELTRVDNFTAKGFPDMEGLLMDTCNDVVWKGWEGTEMPNRRFFPPSGGDQTSSVLITGDSSGIVLQNCEFVAGADPRILMESTEPLTLDNILEYDEAESGDCIVEVPAGTTEDLILQVNSDQSLSKSGNCWVLD